MAFDSLWCNFPSYSHTATALLSCQFVMEDLICSLVSNFI